MCIVEGVLVKIGRKSDDVTDNFPALTLPHANWEAVVLPNGGKNDSLSKKTILRIDGDRQHDGYTTFAALTGTKEVGEVISSVESFVQVAKKVNPAAFDSSSIPTVFPDSSQSPSSTKEVGIVLETVSLPVKFCVRFVNNELGEVMDGNDK